MDGPDSIGRLVPVDLRSIWPHEAMNFTPWLVANIEELGEVLGFDLEVTGHEEAVGGYAADIVARDQATDRVVVIENMLGTSDHMHVGQLVTYAAGLDVAYAVLVAPKFRDEHRSALTWLNDISGTEHGFFGVEVSAVRIGDSVPAPLFDVVVRPDDWQRQVRETVTTEATAAQQRNLAWWSEFIPAVHERYPGWTASKVTPRDSWWTLPAGRTGVQYSVVWGMDETRHLRVEFYMDDGARHYADVARHREQIDAALTGDVEWRQLPDAKASRLFVRLDLDPDDRTQWPAARAWALDRLGELRQVMQPIVTTLR